MKAVDKVEAAPDVAVSFSPVATVLIWVPAKVATPAALVPASRPAVTGDGEPESVMVAPLIGLLNPSFAVTVKEAMFEPATTVAGSVLNVRLLIVPATTLNDVDGVAPLERLGLVDDAANVTLLLTALIVMPEKLARPVAPVDAEAPLLITPVDGASVTFTPLVETGLPKESAICTVTDEKGVPAVTVDGGCPTNTNLFAVPAVTLNALETTEPVPDVAVSFWPVAAVLI